VGTRINVDYLDYSADNNVDNYISSIETFAVQGFDGFIVDSSENLRIRLLDLMDELQLNWMPGMTSAYDDDGHLAHPTVCFDTYQFGRDMVEYLVTEAKGRWGDDLDFTRVGLIEVDYSVVFEITERQRGVAEAYGELYPDLIATNYWVADCVVQGGLKRGGGLQ
jgi:DNA-binding LacI/PurR family transcriptional regulator